MKRMVRATLVLALFVTACSTYDVEGLALVAPLNSIVVGDTVSLSVVTLAGVVRPASGVSWTSSDETIATVDEGGLVRGTGPGSVLLEARTQGYTLEVLLLVLETAGPFVSTAAGADHSCALAEDGTAWCWGRNQYGQLGTSEAPDRCPIPGGGTLFCAAGAIPVASERFAELAVGSFHNCGLSSTGIAGCWGLNDRGQLGDGGTASGPTPLPVAGENIFQSLTAGAQTTCGIRADDALICWGAGPFRVDGVTIDTLTTPSQVAEEHRFAVVATTGGHTCGVTTAGATYCWGLNDRGQLGVESVDSICGSAACTLEPQEVVSPPPFVELALGDGFSCGLTADGTAHCWGANDQGQLGDGTFTDRWAVGPVTGGHVFSRLATGSNHACGIDAEARLLCWGRDLSGFGTGEDPIDTDRPTPAAPGLAFTEMGIGFDSQCGVAVSGITWCWGGNLDGAVGNGRPQSATVTTPERVIRHPSFSSRLLPG
jgi:alpha-tubulin suppressor-like RCC1 family protein